MQFLCNKIGFFSFIKKSLSEEDCTRIEDYLQFFNERHSLSSEDEDKLCDYLYCLLRVCGCDVKKFFDCIKVPYPLEVIFNHGGISLDKEAFERIVSIRLGRKNAEEILNVCENLATSEPSCFAQKNYGDFYTLLFVCGFEKDTFMRNLADRYELSAYRRQVTQEDMEVFKTFFDVSEIENALKLEIENRSSKETYRERDRYDESPSHFKPWPFDIRVAVTQEKFTEQLAWMIYEVFPDSSWEDYKKRIDADMSLLSHRSAIASMASSSSIQKVIIQYRTMDGTHKLEVKSPQQLERFRNSFVDYYKFVEGATAVDGKDYARQIEAIKEDLGTRLLRRVALLLCYYGLYHESEDNDESYDFWFLDSGEKHFVKFGSEYGSLIFDLLKSVEKCEQVLFGGNRKGIVRECDEGLMPSNGEHISKKAKWDLIKYRLKKSEGWQKEEIQIEEIRRIPYSMKMFKKFR